MTVNVMCVQSRRIGCHYCKNPFIVSFGETNTVEARFNILDKDKKAMRKTLAKNVNEYLFTTAKSKKKGIGRCPHCQKFQPWMKFGSYVGRMVGFSILWAALIAALGLAVATILDLSETNAIYMTIAGGSLGFPFGLIVGALSTRKFLRSTFGDGKDLRVMRDDEFRQFVQECDNNKQDPAEEWNFRILGYPVPGDVSVYVSLGFKDVIGGLDIPKKYHTKHVIKELEKSI